jgi:nicotinamide-nucleotide adenylyltransferase
MLQWIRPLDSTIAWKHLYILDSSFNPPTIAHLSMINNCPKDAFTGHVLLLSTFNMDKVVKDIEQRIDLVNQLKIPFAVTDSGRFVDKATLFDVPTTFVMGYDTMIRFFNPKYYDNYKDSICSFFKKSRIRMIDRASELVPVWERNDIKDAIQWKKYINIIPGFNEPISSTECRRLLKMYYETGEKAELERLVPQKVLQTIIQKQYYKSLT